MPKRKAKRSVGRPKKSKIKSNIVGTVLPLEYGSFRFFLDNIDNSLDVEKRIVKTFFRELCEAEAWMNNEYECNKDAPNQIALELLDLRTVLPLLKLRTQALQRREPEEKWCDYPGEQLLQLALAFTVAQLYTTALHRKHEASYAVGKKLVASAQQGGQRRRIERPAKSDLSSALKAEIAKHGKRTMAVSNVAKHHEVSPNTVRAWMKELSITLK
jgi:hypothetical protein